MEDYINFSRLKDIYEKRTQSRVMASMSLIEDAIYCNDGLIASLEYVFFNKEQKHIILQSAPPETSELDLERY